MKGGKHKKMKKKMSYSEAALEVILFEDLGESHDLVTVSGWVDPGYWPGDSNVDSDGWI